MVLLYGFFGRILIEIRRIAVKVSIHNTNIRFQGKQRLTNMIKMFIM